MKWARAVILTVLIAGILLMASVAAKNMSTAILTPLGALDSISAARQDQPSTGDR